jgi:hypothetical protein
MILSGKAREAATMSNGRQTAFDAEMEAVRERVEARREPWLKVTSPEEMRAMELEAAELGRSVADAITEDVLRARVSEPAFVATALAAALSGEAPMRQWVGQGADHPARRPTHRGQGAVSEA